MPDWIEECKAVGEKRSYDARLLPQAAVAVVHVTRDTVQQYADRHSKWVGVLVIHEVRAECRQVIQLHHVIAVTWTQRSNVLQTTKTQV